MSRTAPLTILLLLLTLVGCREEEPAPEPEEPWHPPQIAETGEPETGDGEDRNSGSDESTPSDPPAEPEIMVIEDHTEEGWVETRAEVYRTRDGSLVKHGTATVFYKGGQPEARIEYRHGKKHGTVIRFYPNGQKKQEATYRNGELHGSMKAWSPEGKLLHEAQFRDGQPVR